MSTSVLRRVVRRETHSPRSVAAVFVLVLVIVAAVYTGVGIVLDLFGIAPLLMAPGAVLAAVARVPDAVMPATVVGIAATAVGVVLFWLAVSPGRKAKHQLSVTSHAVVADNAVIASAVAGRVRRDLDLPHGGVVVGIGHRSADVTVRPEPGQRVSREQVRASAEAELAAYAPSPRLRTRARVQRIAEAGIG